MFYIGMDVHGKWTRIEGFDPATGETVSFPKVDNDVAVLREVLSSLDGPVHAAMEIGTNAWAMYWTLHEIVDELIVVDSLDTWGREGRRGAKTDKRDAKGLAKKLYEGKLKALYVPDKQTQDYRCLVRARVSTMRRVTALVNEVGAVLRSWGIIVESSLLTDKGRMLIKESRERLPENSILVLDSLLSQLDCVRKEEDLLTERIEQIASEDSTCQLLMSIPSVGSITAFAVRAEVGDIRRFPSAKHLVSYCGLGPLVEQSAEKCRNGKLPNACNKILRYLLLLRGSSLATLKGDNPLKRSFFRAALRGHVNDGKVSAARKLVRIMYAMMTYKESWNPAKAAART